MDKDVQTSSSPKGKREQENQNRRQFFNSLGKWSLAVVAAVAAFPLDFHLSGAGKGIDSSPETQFGAKDARQQIAVQPKPTPHKKRYNKTWTDATAWIDNIIR